MIDRNHGNVDAIEKDLKNLTKGYKIKDINYSPKLIKPSEAKSEYESWDETSEESVQLENIESDTKSEKIIHPSELLTSTFPEIEKSDLDKNEKETILYIINRRVYECTIYFMKNIYRTRKDLIIYIEEDKQAHWEFIYIEVYSKITKEYFRLILKETEVRQMLFWANEQDTLIIDGETAKISQLIVKSLDIKDK